MTPNQTTGLRLPGRRPRGSRNGSVLVYGLAAVLTVGILGAASFEITSAMTRRQARALDQKLSFYMAEAGLAEARTGVLLGKTGSVGSPASPALFGDGLFWVEATDLGNSQVRLESVGMVGSGRATLSVVLRRGEFDVASLGVFSDADMTFKPGTDIQWFDSGTGQSSARGSSGPGARVGSNGNIVVEGSPLLTTEVNGSLSSGPNGSVTISPDATHNGTIAQLGGSQVLPPVDVPTVHTYPGVSHRNVVPLIIPPGDFGAPFLEIATGCQVIVTGPGTLVLDSLSVASGAGLTFDTTNGDVRVVVKDALTMASGSSLTTSSDEIRKSYLEVSEQTVNPVQLLGTGPFYGVFYAPQAEVVVADSFEVFGSLVGQRLTFQGQNQLNFDQSLLSVPTSSAFPALVSWRLEELANAGPLGTDPFQVLGVDSAVLPAPAEAHADVHLEISYVDTLGVTRLYDGPESAFDWSLVDSVLYANRDGKEVVPLGKTQSPVAVMDQAAIDNVRVAVDYIDNLANSSADVRDFLVRNSPLPDRVLNAAIERTPSLASSDLERIMDTNPELSETVLSNIVGKRTLNDADLTKTLIANSPLPGGVLGEVLGLIPPLPLGDVTAILAAQ